MSKDKVESRTEHCTLHQHYREECINCRVHRKAALPSVPEQGQAESDELAMGRAGTFLKSHGIYGDTSFVGVCGLLVLYERALAASRSEAQPPIPAFADYIETKKAACEDCFDTEAEVNAAKETLDEILEDSGRYLFRGYSFKELTEIICKHESAGAPAAGSAERQDLDALTLEIQQIFSNVKIHDSEKATYVRRALAGTDTDVEKEK